MTTQRPARRAAEQYPQVDVTSRSQLRAWLATSRATSRGAWVVTWKRHVGEAHVDASTIAEVALCFGWVDSLPRALDADRSMLLITPRRAKRAWSALNKRRVERLLAEGHMTASGLAVVEAAKRSGTWDALDAVEALQVPEDLQTRFARAHPSARTNFEAFPRSARRGILEWIHAAKKPETRAMRVEETVTRAERNERAHQWRP